MAVQIPVLPAISVAWANIDVVPFKVKLVVVIKLVPDAPPTAKEIGAEQVASEKRRRLVAVSDRFTVSVGVCVAPGDTGLMEENVTTGFVVSMIIAF